MRKGHLGRPSWYNTIKLRVLRDSRVKTHFVCGKVKFIKHICDFCFCDKFFLFSYFLFAVPWYSSVEIVQCTCLRIIKNLLYIVFRSTAHFLGTFDVITSSFFPFFYLPFSFFAHSGRKTWIFDENILDFFFALNNVDWHNKYFDLFCQFCTLFFFIWALW